MQVRVAEESARVDTEKGAPALNEKVRLAATVLDMAAQWESQPMVELKTSHKRMQNKQTCDEIYCGQGRQ